MDMRSLKAGDLFIAVRPGDIVRGAKVISMMVVRVGRKYVYAKEADCDTRWDRETQFDRDTGKEASEFRPMQAYPDHEAFEKDRLRKCKVSQAERDMRDYGRKWDRLSDQQLDVLISLLGTLSGKEPTP